MENEYYNVNAINSISQNPFNQNLAEEQKQYEHKLNGYDSGILQEKSFLETANLDIEYKISDKQKEINELSGKIKQVELYGSSNEVMVLKSRKHRLERELMELNKEQILNQSELRNIEQKFSNLLWLKKFKSFVSKNILPKFSKRYGALAFLGDSLETLADINKQVDELLEMNVPYGERMENYERLTQYLTRANQIHAQLSQKIKKQ